MATHFTVGEVARIYETGAWRIRRIVDDLDAEIPRAGLYRLIPRSLLPRIGTELLKRGWAEEAAEREVVNA